MSNSISKSPETMEPREAPSAGVRRLVTRSQVLELADPAAFLRMMAGGPRGFWARGSAWVAHGGSIATLRIDAGDQATDRFGRIWQEAQASLSVDDSRATPDDDHPPRFYGGFAFREDQPDTGAWAGFPAALFTLPELELELAGGVITLRAHSLADSASGVGPPERALAERLGHVCDALGGSVNANPGVQRSAPFTGQRDGVPGPGERMTWDRVINKALGAIAADEFSKVVLARTLGVGAGAAGDPVDVLMSLWSDNPRAHVFLFEPQPGATLLGAAPETVATVYGTSFHATAVAGSAPHGASPEETAKLAGALLASRKDQLEHRFAVEDMVERLQPISLDVGAEWEPHVITLSRIQHLETRIRAQLPAGCTVLDALAALHPTPAVCGLPRDPALRFIHTEEPFDRGWYAGPVGWFDVTGSGVFAPALRCAVGQNGEWRLFAGAGIVAGSESELEWDETGIKFEPVLRALAASVEE